MKRGGLKPKKEEAEAHKHRYNIITRTEFETMRDCVAWNLTILKETVDRLRSSFDALQMQKRGGRQ